MAHQPHQEPTAGTNTILHHHPELLPPTAAIAEFDLQGQILNVNDVFLRLFEYDKVKAIGLYHQQLCRSETEHLRAEAQLWEKINKGMVVDQEFERVSSSGDILYLQATYGLVPCEADDTNHIMFYAQDITGQKLKEVETKNKLAAIERTQAVIEFDTDGFILAANDNFLFTMGYTMDEIRGKHHRMFCTNTYTNTPEYGLFWQELKNGVPKTGEFMRLKQNGAPIWLQAVYTPILGLDGRPYKVVKFAQDITQLKMRCLEFQGISAAISRSQGMIEFDLNGNILNANDNFLAVTGYKIEEIKGKHHRIFMDPDEVLRAEYAAFWQKLGRGEYDSGEYMRMGKGGKRIWLQASYNPILDLEGNPFKIIKFCSDITETKQFNQEIASKLHALAFSNCLMELSPSGSILSLNAELQKVLGYNQKDLMGKPFDYIMFPSDQHSPRTQEHWNILRQGKSVTAEYRHRANGDQEVWLDCALCPIVSIEGQLTKILIISQDNTARKLTTLDAEGKLTAISRSQAVIEFDITGKILTANENFLNLLEYTKDEVVGQHHRLFIDPAYAATAEYMSFWERLSRGEYFSGEFKRYGKGGKEVWIQATYNPIFDPSGNPVKVVKFASNITEAKLHNAEFEAKISAIDVSQAVIEFDLDGNVVKANRNFLSAMGYTQREIQGHHHSMFCSPEYVKSTDYRDFWLKLNDGEYISGRFHRVGKYNRDVWIQATYNPIRDLNGNVIKVVKYAYDVTQEVQLEQQILAKAKEMSEQLQSLVNSINAVAISSGEASQIAEASSESAHHGFDALAQSLNAIKKIQASSSKVSEIVRVISDLANQTNLLAFNAAIEASRAGQYGVGFSVVASEVRKLAERSALAAKEIANLIDESAQNVNEGSEVSRKAAQSFEGIIESVTQTVSRVTEIAETTKQQRDMATHVTGLIDSLAESIKH